MKKLKTNPSAIMPVMAFVFIICTISCQKKIEEEILDQSRVQTAAKNVALRSAAISITDFGAVGDGKTDNYQAFVEAASYAAKNDNTTINIPAGTFYIAKYRKKKNDPITHIFWKNCRGLKIIGKKGTKISVNGSFFRPLDYITPITGALKSYTSGINPFWFFHCTDLEIRNIEVTGNVQNTTRAPGLDDNNPSVTESDNKLLRFTKCDNVIVDDIYVHHAESDGIMINGDRIGGKWVNSTNIKMTNVRSYNNARLGMAIGGLANSSFKNCRFNYNGFTDGDYGRNDPSGGVDIEPGEFHNNDNIKFEDCAFENNFGGHFLCTAPTTTSGITLRRCSVITGIETPKPQGITILAKNVLIDGCTIKLGTRTMKITNINKPGSTIKITNCLIEGTDNCINSISQAKSDDVVISNNQFNYTSDVITKNFISMETKNLQFLNNKIYISAAAIKSKPNGTHSKIETAIISKGNKFYSDKPSVKPKVSYEGTKLVDDL